MSTLSYKPFHISSIGESERVFEITSGSDSGCYVKVTVTRSEDDFDGDGVPDQINLKILGALVDENAKPIQTTSGSFIKIPAKVEGILTSAIAEGLVNIAELRAAMTDDAIHRVIRQKAAILAWETIPSEMNRDKTEEQILNPE